MEPFFETRRQFHRSALLSFMAAMAGPAVFAEGPSGSAPSRREIIRQRLPGSPPRDILLVKVSYPPGTGSPAHLHANGVMAFVVSGSIVSKIGDTPEQSYGAGEAWWEPAGAVHRISRNPSKTEPAALLAIYIAPSDASPADLMKPL